MDLNGAGFSSTRVRFHGSNMLKDSHYLSQVVDGLTEVRIEKQGCHKFISDPLEGEI